MDTLVLTAADVGACLTLRECIGAVADAFESLGAGRAQPPVTIAVHSEGGAFHTKAGILERAGRRFFAVKTNGNFPGNHERGLPTIQGLLMLCDADDGRVLAVMDSIEITALRTAAATAVAARYLARMDSDTVVICGCGVQGRTQLRALLEVLPIRRVIAFDASAERADGFVREMSQQLKVEISASRGLEPALAQASVCVTCTTSKEFILTRSMVRPGMFVAGVGVDNEYKRELAPDLLASARVVTDLRTQCAQIGDLHHAIDAGVMTAGDVHADLGDIVAGARPGRTAADEIFVFDSTGLALQDVAAAIAVYESAADHRTGGAVRTVTFA